MITYQEAVDYLYTRTPLFQNQGSGAYKEGLSNTIALDNHFGNPHRSYKTIHIAGTNGKGSCSHSLASILQESGYKVGLYTSPHLVDFRERIRVNGEMIPKQRVIDFVEDEKDFFEPLHPSFFEVTTALAFKYFEEQKVDVAVIEVGLGGRLDCTNIIRPVFSIITNISFDHMQFLGNTLAKIAGEKAGIIKTAIPVIIGETVSETRPVFAAKALQEQSPIIFAEDTPAIQHYETDNHGIVHYTCRDGMHLSSPLSGYCQIKNINTICHTFALLKQLFPQVTDEHIIQGIAHVITNTHLMGRWQKLSETPLTYCDTGHNPGGFAYIAQQLKTEQLNAIKRNGKLRIVLGMVNDKDTDSVLSALPSDAIFYFCQESVSRSRSSQEMLLLAQRHGIEGRAYDSVSKAYDAAMQEASTTDFIFVGGSTFVVSDLFQCLGEKVLA